jgi:hypothetical protein
MRKNFGQYRADLADDLVVRLEELRGENPSVRDKANGRKP